MAWTSHFLFALTGAVLLAAPAADAAEWPRVAGQGTDWVQSLEEPQWPSAEPQWPSVAGEVGGSNAVERRFPKPWSFEIGARYWYSRGTTKFGFSNGIYPYGSPTSTLDWNATQGHAGEVFGRFDHRPSGVFVKALGGGGILRGGEIIDRDYTIGQYTFSDTTSEVHGNNLRYATIDVGMSYELPRYGVRFGGFVGYHYWSEKMTAYGLVCNADAYALCASPGQVLYPTSVAVGSYEPTWHALRIGADARLQINRQWSVSGEAALIPIAWLDNKDSHLLRQDMSDLGPAPNIRTSGTGFGGMAEIFVNYAVTPNLEVGLGARYWGINALKGDTKFGPDFGQGYQLDNFDQNRFGVLAQIKGRL